MQNNPNQPESLNDAVDEEESHEEIPPKPPSPQFSLSQYQAETRRQIATQLINIMKWTLVGIGAIIIIDRLIILIWDKKVDDQTSQTSREIITLILTSQATLIGGAIGYYFGNQESKNKN